MATQLKIQDVYTDNQRVDKTRLVELWSEANPEPFNNLAEAQAYAGAIVPERIRLRDTGTIYRRNRQGGANDFVITTVDTTTLQPIGYVQDSSGLAGTPASLDIQSQDSSYSTDNVRVVHRVTLFEGGITVSQTGPTITRSIPEFDLGRAQDTFTVRILAPGSINPTRGEYRFTKAQYDAAGPGGGIGRVRPIDFLGQPGGYEIDIGRGTEPETLTFRYRSRFTFNVGGNGGEIVYTVTTRLRDFTELQPLAYVVPTTAQALFIIDQVDQTTGESMNEIIADAGEIRSLTPRSAGDDAATGVRSNTLRKGSLRVSRDSDNNLLAGIVGFVRGTDPDPEFRVREVTVHTVPPAPSP